MLLADFFSITEGESYVTNRKTTTEDKSGSTKSNPCWKGYRAVGTKQKGDKTVPNCVPNNKGKINEGGYMDDNNNQSNEDFINYINHDEVDNQGYMPDLLHAKELINQALQQPDTRGEYFDFLKSIRRSHSKEYSTMIHQKATDLTKQHKV